MKHFHPKHRSCPKNIHARGNDGITLARSISAKRNRVEKAGHHPHPAAARAQERARSKSGERRRRRRRELTS
jgi:hypothetical protein